MTQVGLVQINNSFSGQNYLPYSIGILQAYAQIHLKNPSNFHFMLPLYKRMPVDAAVEQLKGADIVFFSLYVWNANLSLEIARNLKDARPDVLTVFGGPHVPDRSEAFLRRHPYVDIAVHNEGEQAFTAVLGNMSRADRSQIPSISYLKDGAYLQNERAERLKDLSVIPSPYLSGLFDPLMKAHPEEQWLVMWETNRGCPFSCTFCDWGSATASKVFQFQLDRIYKELEWVSSRKIEFMFCADANFGILPRDLDIVLHAAELKKKTGYPKALSVQNTKNATERAYQVQKTLAEAGLNKGVTIAFQSIDPDTLKNIKRDNISSDSFRELQRRFTRDGIETYSDMILALPGETYDTFADGVSETIALGQHNRIQFGNLSILPNAEMGDPQYQKKYGMKTVQVKEVIFHGVLQKTVDGIDEVSQVVVETASMPREQWARTRAFCWMTSLLHFDKIFQIPFVVLHEAGNVSYRDLIEVFSEGSHEDYPTLKWARDFFVDKAERIQNGEEEYVPAPQYLNIWWPADEYIFIQLVKEGRLEAFYAEAEHALEKFLRESGAALPQGLLHEAIELNRRLIKIPFQTEDLTLRLDYNIWNFYRAVLRGLPVPLEKRPAAFRVDRTSKKWASWDDWCREVVWYGNKKGAYLYSQAEVEAEISGHY